MLFYNLSVSQKLTRCSSRARHVKCDETRPVCQRCVASQRHCKGYSDDPNDMRNSSALVHIAPRRPRAESTCGPLRAMTNIHMRLSSVECQAFDFFRLETIEQLPGGSSDLLWERLALSMSASEPAVAHAVVALASLHRSFARGGLGNADSTQYQLALQYCNKAMSSIRGIIAVPSTTSHPDGDVEILLILTLLLFSFEVLHGHWDRAALHLRSGLRVVYDNIRCQPDQLQHQGLREDSARHVVLLRVTPCSNIDIMLRAFVRLDGDSISGGEDGYVCPSELMLQITESHGHADTFILSVTNSYRTTFSRSKKPTYILTPSPARSQKSLTTLIYWPETMGLIRKLWMAQKLECPTTSAHSTDP